MGCGGSKGARHLPIRLGLEGEGVAIRLVDIKGVPDVDAHDLLGHTDPYVLLQVFELTDGNRRRIGTLHKSRIRHNCTDPVYNEVFFFELGRPPRGTDVLVIKLLDHDTVKHDEHIGNVAFALEEIIGVEQRITKKLTLVQTSRVQHSVHGKASAQPTPCRVTIRLCSAPHRRVTLFCIRHAESRWNQHKSPHFDHPLTLTGIEQAKILNKTWLDQAAKLQPSSKAGSSGSRRPSDVLLSQFLRAPIITSPLTRAAQTCLIGLQGHPVMERDGIRFARSLRENKSWGGIDCVGIAVGPAVADRIEKMTLQDTKGDTKLLAKMMAIKMDGNDIKSQWWTSMNGHDDKQDILQEHLDLIHSAMYGVSDVLIAVGHSHWFRSFCAALASQSPAFLATCPTKDNDALVFDQGGESYENSRSSVPADDLAAGKKKIGNADVMAITLDLGEFATIVSADWMFGGKFAGAGV